MIRSLGNTPENHRYKQRVKHLLDSAADIHFGNDALLPLAAMVDSLELVDLALSHKVIGQLETALDVATLEIEDNEDNTVMKKLLELHGITFSLWAVAAYALPGGVCADLSVGAV